MRLTKQIQCTYLSHFLFSSYSSSTSFFTNFYRSEFTTTDVILTAYNSTCYCHSFHYYLLLLLSLQTSVSISSIIALACSTSIVSITTGICYNNCCVNTETRYCCGNIARLSVLIAHIIVIRVYGTIARKCTRIIMSRIRDTCLRRLIMRVTYS